MQLTLDQLFKEATLYGTTEHRVTRAVAARLAHGRLPKCRCERVIATRSIGTKTYSIFLWNVDNFHFDVSVGSPALSDTLPLEGMPWGVLSAAA